MQPTFRTILPPPEYDFALSYPQPILCLGLCFAEAIGGRLAAGKFPTLINPFGITYHPLALAANLRRLTEGGNYQLEELFKHQEVWRHFDFHGRSVRRPNTGHCIQAARRIGNLYNVSWHNWNSCSAYIPGSTFRWKNNCIAAS